MIGRFSKETIERHLHTAGLSLQVYDCVSSTNTLAKMLGEQGIGEGAVIISRAQSDGRGTRGRSFYSPADTGLYMSVLLRPTLLAENALLITVAAAVAVCRAIERVSSKAAQIKWVNDVYCDGKKVCGILTESALDTKTGLLDWVVLGIGVNVRDPAFGFPKEIKDIAASVFGTQDTDPAPLAAAILDDFFAEYAHLEDQRFVAEYRKRSLLVGREITVKTREGDKAATALGVDERCRLSVRFADGREEVLLSGDVSIRI